MKTLMNTKISNQSSAATIQDAYIAVEFKTAATIKGLQAALCETLKSQGVQCENASASLHASIAYTEGAVTVAEIESTAQKIAAETFKVNVGHYEILEGKMTPYDYLVISLNSAGDFENAVEIVEDQMITRRFEGGFKSHVSLLRFEKGTLALALMKLLIRELNASQGAAQALGRSVSLEGSKVCVFDPQRQCRFQVPFSTEVAGGLEGGLEQVA
jgi:hypothetical protein